MRDPAASVEAAPPIQVFIEWEGRSHPLGRVVRRRRRLAKLQAPRKERSGPDIPDGCADGCVDVPDSLDELAAIAVIIVVVVALIAYGPGLLALLVEALFVVLVTILIVVAAAWRTLFRRPWRVVALRGWDEIWVWHQVGFRAARRLVTAVKAELAANRPPSPPTAWIPPPRWR